MWQSSKSQWSNGSGWPPARKSRAATLSKPYSQSDFLKGAQLMRLYAITTNFAANAEWLFALKLPSPPFCYPGSIFSTRSGSGPIFPTRPVLRKSKLFPQIVFVSSLKFFKTSTSSISQCSGIATPPHTPRGCGQSKKKEFRTKTTEQVGEGEAGFSHI